MSQLSQAIQDDIRAAEPGWCAARVRCGLCGHTMVTAFPVECPVHRLQCSKCHQQGHTVLIEEIPVEDVPEDEQEHGDFDLEHL